MKWFLKGLARLILDIGLGLGCLLCFAYFVLTHINWVSCDYCDSPSAAVVLTDGELRFYCKEHLNKED